MFGSYGSYSSMCANSAPLDMSSRSLAAVDATCAFPSWPRRSSFTDDREEERPTSYLSDDDLSLCDSNSSVFDDDNRSISSAGSASSPLAAAPLTAISSPHAPVVTEAQLQEMERERRNLQRDFVRCLVQEKERRRAAARKQRRSSPSSSKKSPKSKHATMAPIDEE